MRRQLPNWSTDATSGAERNGHSMDVRGAPILQQVTTDANHPPSEVRQLDLLVDVALAHCGAWLLM